ncbi:MAG TPA: type II toxin-antitoxin system RelE/ParE family toxin [Rhodanobacteraceae bacterium]
MPQLIWTPSALADVKRLHGFLVDKDAEAARRAVRAIRESVNILSRHPHVGKPVEGMDPEFREWLIDFGSSGYVALYRLDDADVSILAVRHQREVGIDVHEFDAS